MSREHRVNVGKQIGSDCAFEDGRVLRSGENRRRLNSDPRFGCSSCLSALREKQRDLREVVSVRGPSSWFPQIVAGLVTRPQPYPAKGTRA